MFSAVLLAVSVDPPSPVSWADATIAVVAILALFVSGVGVMLSALLSAVTIYFIWRESRERLADKRDLEAAQARLVFGRVFNLHLQDAGDGLTLSYVDPQVTNNSQLLLPWVQVRILPSSAMGLAPWSSDALNDIPPGTFNPYTRELHGASWNVGGHPVPPGIVHDPACAVDVIAEEIQVELLFMDASGLVWRRRGLQAPERVHYTGPIPESPNELTGA